MMMTMPAPATVTIESAVAARPGALLRHPLPHHYQYPKPAPERPCVAQRRIEDAIPRPYREALALAVTRYSPLDPNNPESRLWLAALRQAVIDIGARRLEDGRIPATPIDSRDDWRAGRLDWLCLLCGIAPHYARSLLTQAGLI